MALVTLAPILNGWQGLTSTGLPLNGGFIYTYQAGTSTPLATYTTSAGSTPNANPIVLGSDGRPMGKSLKNFIPISGSNIEMYGQIMSIVDNVIFDYLIRSNISTIINVIELIEFLKLAPTKLFYAGGAICNLQLLDPIGGICDNTLMGTDYVMGTSIIFSKDLIDVIINVNLRYDIVDDVSFGLIMKKLNIKINTYITSYINISKLNLNQITNNYIFYRNKSENRYKDIDKIIYMIKLLKK